MAFTSIPFVSNFFNASSNKNIKLGFLIPLNKSINYVNEFSFKEINYAYLTKSSNLTLFSANYWNDFKLFKKF